MPFFDNDPDPNDPTRQCTCGYRRFTARAIKATEAVDRYVLFDETASGFGAVPFGLPFGGGLAGNWGLFSGTLRSFSEQLSCENCQRIRSTKLRSAYALFGSFVNGTEYCVIASDVSTAGLGCYELRFDGPGPSVTAPLKFSYPILPLAVASPGGATYASPPGASASMLCATLPPVAVEGEYTVVFVDRCGGSEQALGTVTLESDVIILNPRDADLNGAPEIWIQENHRSQQETVQIASGSFRGIPFDKCSAVIEYDARFGTVPSSQSFVPTGAPGEILLPGGVVQITSAGGAVPRYFTRDVTLSAAVDRVNIYARYQHRSNVDADAVGAGFNILGAYAAGASTPFNGGRIKHYDDIRMTMLDGSADTAGALSGTGKQLEGWREVALQHHEGDNRALFHLESPLVEEVPALATFGTIAGPAGSATLRCQFGDIEGSGIDTIIRNLVVSAPGRFMRPYFQAFATVNNPVLRLHMMADLLVGPARTMRFLVRYGALGVGADPYAVPASTTELTVDFVNANQVFLPSFTLSGLTAGTPFWFSVERNHLHVDDLNEATAFLIAASVRAL